MPVENTESGQQGQQQASGDQGGQQGQQGSQQATQNTDAQGQQGQQSAQGQQQQPRTGAQTGFTYTEDRSRWIPPHRLNEETTKRTRLETELETTRRQLQAVTGQQPQDANTQKQEQVREAFFTMFPAMRKFANLTDEQIEQVLSAPQALSRTSEIEQREWSRHGKAQMTTLYSDVAEAIGADTLTPAQQTSARSAFKSWFEAKVNEEVRTSKQTTGEETSATFDRYEAGDPKLLGEFVKEFTESWIEPARRKVTAQNITRTRPVVNSAGRSQVTSVQRPAEFKSIDERLDYAVKLAKERGVQFGG